MGAAPACRGHAGFSPRLLTVSEWWFWAGVTVASSIGAPLCPLCREKPVWKALLGRLAPSFSRCVEHGRQGWLLREGPGDGQGRAHVQGRLCFRVNKVSLELRAPMAPRDPW